MIADSAPHRRGLRGEVIGEARGHQQPADIGEAEAERAVVVGKLGDFARGELRHQHRDFQHHGPQPHRVLIGRDVEFLRLRIAELQQVQRGEIAGRVVQEHIFGARIGGADFAAGRAGVPVVDGGVELQAGIGRGPGGIADLFPQVAGVRRSWRPCRRCGGSDSTAHPAPPRVRKPSVTRTELLEFWPETVR